MTRRPVSLTPGQLALCLTLRRDAATSGGALSAARARELGAVDGDIRVLIQSGGWRRARRGVYVDDAYRSTAPDPDHASSCAEVLAACRGGVLSHLSAARMLAYPVPARLGDRVWLTRKPPAHGNPPGGACVRVADYDEADVLIVDGLPVLAGARVVIDCAVVLDPPDALAVADAAIRAGDTDPDALARELALRSGHPGTAGIGLVVERADGASESWFESTSRWWWLEAGLPRPRLQVEFQGGGRLARVDMLFDEFATVGEADGRIKYTGAGGADALVEEKLREEWLRDAFGLEFVRWMPRDLATPVRRGDVVRRFLAAFSRGRRRHS